MLGLGAFTKNEGLTLIVAVAIALASTRRWRDIVRLWPAIVMPAPWLVMRSLHRLPTDITSGNVIARILQHLSDPGLLSALALYPLGKRLFWLGILIGIALTFRRLIARERFLLAALGFQFLFYIAAYLATPHDVQWHVRWSWERLVSHLTPALTVLLLLNLAALWRPASD